MIVSLITLRFARVQRAVRLISQFRLPQTDCWTVDGPPKKVINPSVCDPRDRGLVLGVFYNDFASCDNAILTASAERYDRANGGKLWRLLKLSPIPRLGEARVFFDVDPSFGYVAVAGLGSECLAWSDGEQRDEGAEAVRVAAAAGARAVHKLNPTDIHVESFGCAEAAAEGAALAIWGFREYRRPDKPPRVYAPRLHLYDDCDIDGWRVGAVKAEAQNLARYLQEMPANILNPTEFAKIAVELLCELDINVEVKTKGWAASHDMGGFVAIGASSVQPPLYVEVSYYGAGEARPVVLIGKGVTFDSGSLDLKPVHQLRYMRGDMAGAAVVLAVTRAAALLRLPVNVRGILPLCELMPSGRAPRSGDVVCSSGGSVRVRLPAREGRLLLADSLVHARNYWPKALVDVGTMSEELVDTLGGGACAAYCNSEPLYQALAAAAGRTGDRVWRMPLWRHYTERVRDTHSADIANTGRTLLGDSPACAAFLREFVCDSQWLHLDTYSVAYTKGAEVVYLPRGMTGRPTRTLVQLLYELLAASPPDTNHVLHGPRPTLCGPQVPY